MIDIVDRINELIDKRGWTSYELAKQTGISTNSIYGWNNGAVPSLSNVIRVCEALDITGEQFVVTMRTGDLPKANTGFCRNGCFCPIWKRALYSKLSKPLRF